MRNNANDTDNPDKVGRTRVHVGPMGNYVDQVIAVQTGHAIETQAAKLPLVKMTIRRDVEGRSETPNGAGLHMTGSTGASE